MRACTRDVAKFVAGFAANEAVGHWVFGIWGSSLFPMKLIGVTFTREFNWFAMGFWPLVVLLCVYLGWCPRSSAASGSEGSSCARRATGGA